MKGAFVGVAEGAADSFNKGFADGVKPLDGDNALSLGSNLNKGPKNGLGGLSPMGGATGLAGIKPQAGASTGGVSAGIAGVQGDAKAARNLTVHIGTLGGGDINIHTTKVEQGYAQIKEHIRECLVDAIRDVELLGA